MIRKLFVIIFISLILQNKISAQELPLKGICAHRGASSAYPENTLAAIEQAVLLGVQMIEFDVRSTKDEALVLMHDETVDRTTNGKGAVKGLTLAEIAELDAGNWKDEKFKGEKVPTFEEVLNLIPDTIWMNIHIKHEYETAVAVANLLIERNQIRNVVLAVDNDVVDTVKAINSNIKICCMERGNTPDDYIDNAVAVNADFIQLKDRSFSRIKEIVAKLKLHHIVVNYYHAEDYETVKILFDAGVDFVLVNNVKAMMYEAKKNRWIK